MAVEQTEQPSKVIDPADFSAWEAAKLAGGNENLEVKPAEGGPAGEPAKAEAPAVKPEEIASEPAGEKSPEKVEAKPEPEAGKPQEQKTESETREHGPGWYRRELKRIQRQTRDEIAALRTELAAKSKPEPATEKPKPAAPAPPAEPKEEDFNGDTVAYLKAVSRFNAEQIAEQIAARKVAEFQKSVQDQMDREALEFSERQAAEAQAKANEKWAKDVDEGRNRYPDFDEVVLENLDLKIPPFINDYTFLASEHSVDLAYFLATHPAEIARIAMLPQVQQVRELVKIETQFNQKVSPAPNTDNRGNGSLKPKPPTPIGAGHSAAIVRDINDPEITGNYREWERLKRQRMERENRR